jgi:MFS family permease
LISTNHWRQVIGVAFANMPTNVVFYLGSVFAFGYATSQGANRSTVLTVVMVTCAVMAATPFVFFPLIGTGKPLLMLVGYLALFAGFAANYGALNAFLPHQFPASLRYSGVAIGTNLGGVFGGALAPIIATALLARFDSWVPIAIYLLVIMVAAAIATWLLAERPDALDDAAVHDEPHSSSEVPVIVQASA